MSQEFVIIKLYWEEILQLIDAMATARKIDTVLYLRLREALREMANSEEQD